MKHPLDLEKAQSRPTWARGAWTLTVALLLAVTTAVVLLNVIGGDDKASPPALATSDVDPDWDQTVRSIAAFSDWLRLHPDPDLVARYMTRDNPAYAEAVDSTAKLRAGALRYDPKPRPIPVASVDLLEHQGAVARLRVRFGDLPAFRVVDESGKVFDERPAGPGNARIWTLRYQDGQWLLAGTQEG